MCGSKNEFRNFIEGKDIKEIIDCFSSITKNINQPTNNNNITNNNIFDILKESYYNYNKQLWNVLTEKRNQIQYSNQELSKKSILIVGSGPAGLISAIESKLLGANVLVIEKRTSYTRNNVILLWDYTVDYLKTLGAKYIFRKFCVGGLHHIGIRRLQCLLLKVALLLGIEFTCGTAFDSLHENENEWNVNVRLHNTDYKEICLLHHNNNLYSFNCIFGADGLHSNVANSCNFTKKTMKAKQAIGMTFNFINSRKREEVLLNEFGYAKHLKQYWFKELYEKYNLKLENCVYYRDETHYFVCTIPKEDLLHLGIVKNDYSNTNELLAESNLDRNEMKKVARYISLHCKLPEHIPFVINHHNMEDIELFDFTKKLAATEQIRIISPTNECNHNLFSCLVGDSLLEPFFPQGTGGNRALLSALDGIYSLCEYAKNSKDEYDILINSNKILSQLHSSSSNTIKYTLYKTQLDKIGTKQYSNCTFNPSTRYIRYK